ncbi:MAG: hypothetical protein KatS3mg057_1497 [Herpetosiphonaceae bacterium]|nr:MAG: hypothetical protein KatS3mg057_1497 [Herpetosiphonaceae bacterium]
MERKRRKSSGNRPQTAVRLPETTRAQLDWLCAHARLTKAEAIIIAIDRLWSSYQDGREALPAPIKEKEAVED